MEKGIRDFCKARTPTLEKSPRLVVRTIIFIQTLRKNLRRSSISQPCTPKLRLSLDSCTPWEARPVLAFLIAIRRCLGDGEGIAGLLGLSVDSYHTVAVVVVCSVTCTPRGLCEFDQPGAKPRHTRQFQTSRSVRENQCVNLQH